MASILLAVMAAAAALQGQSLKDFEKSVKEFTLANGMHFIVVERREAPVVAFDLLVDVGGVDENVGQTGVSHLFEHLAFKGTRSIGTKNWALEQKALEALDKAYLELEAERARGAAANADRVKKLEAQFQEAQERADKQVASDEFTQIIERAGGVNINASTSSDATRYFYQLPSNKLELWFSLESARFLDPVVRDYYKERNVVMEERRYRTENDPFGKLFEEFLSIAYKAHPYGQPVVGHRSEITRLRRAEAEEYFKRHYVPAAMTAVIVGDVDPAHVRRLAEAYFGRLPKRPRPDPLRTEEPPQEGERRVTVEAQAQPSVLIGFHRPGVKHPERAVFNVITDILGSGRTSWLYTTLVKEKRIAVATEAVEGYPGAKHPGLFIFYGVPSQGHTAEEVEKGMLEVIERLKRETVPAELLDQVKRRSRAQVLRGLRSNSGLASALGDNHVLLGDWRYLFHDLDEIAKVTAADVQRVARQSFQRKNRTVGTLIPEQGPQQAPAGAKSE